MTLPTAFLVAGGGDFSCPESNISAKAFFHSPSGLDLLHDANEERNGHIANAKRQYPSLSSLNLNICASAKGT
jgi:hypothetical protein